MNTSAHFHTANLRSLFHIIGSGDRDLLKEVGISFGTEFRPEDSEDEIEGEEMESEEWDEDEDEPDAGREIIAKMIMSGLPQDLAEDEAYAVQDFLAAYVVRGTHAGLIEADSLIEGSGELAEDADLVGAWSRMLLEGADLGLFQDLLEFLRDEGASHELVARLQGLCFGRLPDADEPTFTDLEDDAYAARFGYLYAEEAANVADELEEMAGQAEEGEMKTFTLLLAGIFHYCNLQSVDLVVTIEE